MRRVLPSRIAGALPAPASKSVTQRAIAAALLADGTTRLTGASRCDDALAAANVATALGARIEASGDTLRIEAPAALRPGRLDCGESGLCLRMFSAIAALAEGESTLLASGSLAGRPMQMVEAPLRALGAGCTTSAGRAPIRVRGPLRGGHAELDGALSSQALTGLLLALPRAPHASTLRVRALRSKPYVRLTLELLAAFGVEVRADAALTRFDIPGGQRYRPTALRVEGDWSGAAFPLVAGAIAGRVEVRGLSADSAQADRAILDALEAAGARVAWDGDRLRVEQGPLRPFAFDATDCPDLFPPLVALAVHCPGTSRLEGAGRLRHKESDRARALVEELAAVGARVEQRDDALEVHGGPLAGGAASARGDHRIAMALAVAALASRDGVAIEGAQCVAKSYPDFFERLEALRSAR
jgi:3-phosphoshikimate 1-carboxyvinyltransferase